MATVGFRGVYWILTTPFTPDGEVDAASLRRLAAFAVRAGVDGITVLGIMGEAHTLTEEERRLVIATVVDEVAGRLTVLAGVSATGTDLAIRAARDAARLGASGVMLAPPTNLRNLDAVAEHYRRVHDATDLPLVIQDEPTFSGVIMPAAFLASVADGLPRARTIKLEELPSPPKTSAVLRAARQPVAVLGGMGGLYLYEELTRGASGTMTGFAFPEVLVRICRLFRAHDRAGARALFYRFVPLIRFEGQQGIGLAIRKETLRRRGLIDHPGLRDPGMPLDGDTARELTEILDALGLTEHLGQVLELGGQVPA